MKRNNYFYIKRDEKGRFTNGHSVPKNWRKKWKERFKGIHFSAKTEFKKGNRIGNWKGGITPLLNQIRNCEKGQNWRRKIFERDNYTCRNCKDNKGGNLEAHHIVLLAKTLIENKIINFKKAFSFPMLWDIDYGITLCIKCHHISHKEDPLL